MTTPGGSVGPSPIRKDPVVQAPPGRQNSVATLFVDAIAQVFTSLARLTVLALFVITFLLQPSQIPSSSMEPTMLVGDFVLVNKQVFAPAGHWGWLLPYRDPRRDDIVVFHYPVDPTELLVKRVIAVPGDRLHLHRGAVVLNGSSLVEPLPGTTSSSRHRSATNFRRWNGPIRPSRHRGGSSCGAACAEASFPFRRNATLPWATTATTARTAASGALCRAQTS